MDLIKLTSNSSYETELTEGEMINGWTSCRWIERYKKPGEFEIVAPVSSDLKTFLPLGTFVTHLRTLELMRVENHEILEPKDKDPKIKITGRSMVAYLEERIVGQNHVDVILANDHNDYQIGAGPTWEQIRYLIDDHFCNDLTVHASNLVPGFDVRYDCSGAYTSVHRHIKYRPVWDVVEELLEVDDLGIRMIRPGLSPYTWWEIYNGNDKTNSVRFSSLIGDLDNVEYFWSDKKIKNFARVVGRWVQTVTSIGTPVNIDRRYMLIDASDLDNQLNAMPTGTTLTDLITAMNTRGQEALKSQKQLVITQADVNPNSRYRYGWQYDYELGDLVTVDANHNTSQTMRVVEYAEIEDENGYSSHPTLAAPGV